MEKKILIVEDDRFYSKYLSIILGKQFPEHILLHATSVNEAWQIMKQNSWSKINDFVILDVQLPQISGWGLLHRMEKYFAPGKETPRVIINSSLNLSNTFGLPEQGKIRHSFFQKPLNIANVNACLSAA